MSSDNYYLIRSILRKNRWWEFGKHWRYAVSMEFDSDELYAPIDDYSVKWFEKLDDAREYAHVHYSEYGVTEKLDQDYSWDTSLFRLHAQALRLLGRFNISGYGSAEEGKSIGEADILEVHMANLVITIKGKEAWQFVDWLGLTSPEKISFAIIAQKDL